MSKIDLSIVAPVYNEESGLEAFYSRLSAVLSKMGLASEIVFVNDGSQDGSLNVMRKLRRQDPRVKIVNFSRNFGHQIAIKAGLDHASGDCIVMIDADLQDPPEAIEEMVAKAREGYDVVYAVRASREGETFFKKYTASLYYRLIRKIAHIDLPLNAGDFRLITREVAEVVRGINEKNPYLRGLFSWVGFRQTGIFIHRQPRHTGKTKYSYSKMLRLAWNGIAHFSFLPLQLATWAGFLSSLFCFFWMMVALYGKFVLQITVPGWTSLMIAVLFLGSIQLITLGILGSYLARNYDETRSRPLYVLKNKEGL